MARLQACTNKGWALGSAAAEGEAEGAGSNVIPINRVWPIYPIYPIYLADAQGNERLTASGSWWYDTDKMKVKAESMQYKPGKMHQAWQEQILELM